MKTNLVSIKSIIKVQLNHVNWANVVCAAISAIVMIAWVYGFIHSSSMNEVNAVLSK